MSTKIAVRRHRDDFYYIYVNGVREAHMAYNEANMARAEAKRRRAIQATKLQQVTTSNQ